MSGSAWRSIESCPADEIVQLVDHIRGNEPYIGYGSRNLFLTRKGREWVPPPGPPTHWAPIPSLKPPPVMEVGGYAISAGKQDEYILSLFRAGSSSFRLVSLTSPNREYLTAIGKWAYEEKVPWTEVAEAVRKSRVVSE